MKHQVYFGIAFRIIILFSIAIFTTFLPEYLNLHNPQFFNDIGEHWGVRHYWFFCLMILLFLLSLINVIIGSWNIIEKHYNI